MSFIGTVAENGTVTLPPEAKWPAGTRVRIEAMAEEPDPRTFAERFKEFVGVCDDLPPDIAHNHDHYAHGAPKK